MRRTSLASRNGVASGPPEGRAHRRRPGVNNRDARCRIAEGASSGSRLSTRLTITRRLVTFPRGSRRTGIAVGRRRCQRAGEARTHACTDAQPHCTHFLCESCIARQSVIRTRDFTLVEDARGDRSGLFTPRMRHLSRGASQKRGGLDWNVGLAAWGGLLGCRSRR